MKSNYDKPSDSGAFGETEISRGDVIESVSVLGRNEQRYVEDTNLEIDAMDVVQAMFKQQEILVTNQSKVIQAFLANPTDNFENYALSATQLGVDELKSEHSVDAINDLCEKINCTIDSSKFLMKKI